jgi:hypothetical protein
MSILTIQYPCQHNKINELGNFRNVGAGDLKQAGAIFLLFGVILGQVFLVGNDLNCGKLAPLDSSAA